MRRPKITRAAGGLLRVRRPQANVTEAADGSMPAGSRETVATLQPTDYEQVTRLAIQRDPAAVVRAIHSEWHLLLLLQDGQVIGVEYPPPYELPVVVPPVGL